MWPLLIRSFAWLGEQVALSAIPYAIERVLRRMGAKGEVVTMSTDLGSGYDTEEERTKRRDKLIKKCLEVVADPSLFASES